MSKIVSILFTVALAFSLNAKASTMETLAGYDTVILSEAEIAAQAGTAGGLQIDPIIAYTFLPNSGAGTEMAWMSAVYNHVGILDPVFTLDKIEFDSDADTDGFWKDLGNDIYTGELNYGNDNFLIKIGQGKVKYDTFLYRNLEDLMQATLSLASLSEFSGFDGKNFDIYRISHISEVPVPAAFWLFGTALLGFIGFSRRTAV